MVRQLRIYTINKGKLDEFAAGWTQFVHPRHLEFGFNIELAVKMAETNEFVWIVSLDGTKEEFEAKQKAYYDTRHEAGIDPDPARFIAKNIVAAGLAEKCEIQIAYTIGRAEPVSVMVGAYSTGVVSSQELTEIVKKEVDLRPAAIIERLDLLRPIYRKTCNYGHFGRELPEFTWEKTDLVDTLKRAVK